MDNQQKPKSSPGNWAIAIGVVILVAGLLRLVSGVWTPDASASAGDANLMQAVITCVVGAVVVIVGYIIRGKK